MNETRIPWRILALVFGLAMMIVLVVLMMRSGRDTAPAAMAPVSDEVRAPPPNAARDPRATAAFVRSEACRADCASEDRVCRGSAVEPEQETRCAATVRACEAACR